MSRAGLLDAHAHLALHGRDMTMLRLDRCRSQAECLASIAARAGAAGPGAWLLATGMRIEAWQTPVAPTRHQLDEAGAGRPVGIWSFDHHMLAASSAALRAAGIDAHSPDPAGGVIDRDSAGAPTGVLLENAAQLAWRAVPEPTAAERRQQVRAAASDFARRGIVEVHDMHAAPWLGPLLAELNDAGELPLRVLLYVPLDAIEAAAETAGPWQRDRVRLAGAKLFADGTLNSRTAWMLSDYADPLPGHERGKPMVGPGAIEAAIRRVEALGLSLATHAIGDGAVRAVLDAIETASGYPPTPWGDQPSSTFDTLAPPRGGIPRHRIEHAEIIDEADVPRFGALGVVCSPQPCHLLTDIEVLRRLLPHRLGRVLPLRELINSGLIPGRDLLFGSDAPIVEPEPQDNITAATLRRRAEMPPEASIAPQQAISEQEACAAMRAG
ncbi:MAG: amidohydrolase [Phycisphaerales bacterium JB039]